jgi:hypothetical protein
MDSDRPTVWAVWRLPLHFYNDFLQTIRGHLFHKKQTETEPHLPGDVRGFAALSRYSEPNRITA